MDRSSPSMRRSSSHGSHVAAVPLRVAAAPVPAVPQESQEVFLLDAAVPLVVAAVPLGVAAVFRGSQQSP